VNEPCEQIYNDKAVGLVSDSLINSSVSRQVATAGLTVVGPGGHGWINGCRSRWPRLD